MSDQRDVPYGYEPEPGEPGGNGPQNGNGGPQNGGNEPQNGGNGPQNGGNGPQDGNGGSGGGQPGGGGGGPKGPYVRRDVWALSEQDTWHPIILGYALAVREMISREANPSQTNPTFKTSWRFQANMHATFDNGPSWALPFWNNCPHGTWFFFPWHRLFLSYFERIVRSIVESLSPAVTDWALPYWNYSDDPAHAVLPPAFRSPNLPAQAGGGPNPLFLSQRRPSVNAGQPLAATAVAYLTPPPFGSYTPVNFGQPPSVSFGGSPSSSGTIELQPHNPVHGAVGGLMGSVPTAAQDPIFWLHHANIDRHWDSWLRWGGGRANPTNQTAWMTRAYSFFDETGAQVTGVRVQDGLDTAAQLSYVYDHYTAKPVVTAVAAAAGPGGGGEEVRRLGVSQEPEIRLGARPTVVSAALESDVGVAEAEAGPEVVTLTIHGISADEDPGVGYSVYVNVPSPPGEQSPEHPHYVGLLSFFGATAAEQHDHGGEEGHMPGGERGVSATFDITDLVRRLKEQGTWDPAKVTLTFVPDPLVVPPPGVAAAEAVAEPAGNPRIAGFEINAE
jgi:Common central domain of tyrosinase/Polyphenol oxidase middle domain/Protein of unknown function (DUF_B2219)